MFQQTTELELGGIQTLMVIPVLSNISLPNRAYFFRTEISLMPSNKRNSQIVTYTIGIRVPSVPFSRVGFEVEWPS